MSLNPNLLFLWGILFLGGYLAFFAALQQDLPQRRMLPALGLAVLFVYLCAIAFTGLLYQYFGSDPIILYGVLVFYAAGLALYLGRLFWRDRNRMRRQTLLWLLVDLAAVFYITLGSRLAEPHTGLRMVPFQNLLQAVESRSLAPLEHPFLNLLLFFPTGFLQAHLGSDRLRRVETGFLSGLVLSTAIETTQLAAQLGLCDINDIISNAIGAAVGVLFHNFLFPRWKRPRT